MCALLCSAVLRFGSLCCSSAELLCRTLPAFCSPCLFVPSPALLAFPLHSLPSLCYPCLPSALFAFPLHSLPSLCYPCLPSTLRASSCLPLLSLPALLAFPLLSFIFLCSSCISSALLTSVHLISLIRLSSTQRITVHSQCHVQEILSSLTSDASGSLLIGGSRKGWMYCWDLSR
jgi:hypothetical protein